MNRLIIIGNGFDLAHGLKTTYRDFIKWYLTSGCNKAYNSQPFSDDLISIKHYLEFNIQLGNVTTVEDYVNLCFDKYLHEFLSNQRISFVSGTSYHPIFEFTLKSPFLKHLLTTCINAGWIDIENEFYKKLNEIFLQPESKGKKVTLERLNQDMNWIIRYLGLYLSDLPPLTLIKDYQDIFRKELPYRNFVKGESLPIEVQVLNFNYTTTAEHYLSRLESQEPDVNYSINYIHGKVGDPSNPLVFGFGDELDDSYLKMEASETKGFLEYIKSFWYFGTNNYHDLLGFIALGHFEVLLLGHSCGLSDRTMLNMIFEHDHCKSLKIHYYDHGNGTTNFKTLTQDISRHFRNKVVMREKIIPFPKSKKMPQWNS